MHDSRLELEPGGDRLLAWIEILACSAGLLAFALSPTPWGWKLAGICCSLAAGFAVAWPGRKPGVSSLLVYPDGRAVAQTAGAGVEEGVISQYAWVTPRYAVIRCRMDSKNHSFLVSESRHRREDFRRLLSWLRLGFPEARPGT